ncbi:hypothetical protein CAEBREN_12778 [Caenorhabditis brenneri]|uniref:Phosphatidylinositol-glycan biosynthesis class X protein n=1 Tax=Caenorhabditis brenneri TaxID=135651 RepID=G0N7S2_CAEBE|nr:hypothetical protein CAEBREN_12778 [Caenorhabditis brenneri]
MLRITSIILTLLIGLCSCCSLIPKDKHGDVQIHGRGLHRQLDITTFIQTQQRVPQCRLLYRIDIPENAYVDERELQSSSPGYEFVTRKHSVLGTNLLYAIKQKLFLSTFEMRDKLSIKLHLSPPSKAHPKTIKLSSPVVAVDCKGDIFNNCTPLQVPNDSRLKAVSSRWLRVKSASNELPEMRVFEGDTIPDERNGLSIVILVLTLFSTMVYLIR